jgi:HTH-type transcriptional regulator, competence development regulator
VVAGKEDPVPEESNIPAGGLTLGERLRRARRQRSLSEVAAAAEISTAYLQKLEAGMVKQPSPNILYQLAQALTIRYAELMRLAGYVVPDEPAESERPPYELRYALSSEELTEQEARELAEYLDWYRERHRK